MTREQVFPVVQGRVAECLALEPEEVGIESRLFADLGADSLDIVELVFLLEKEFKTHLRDTELDFFSRLDFSSPGVLREGALTEEAIEKVRAWLPAISEVPDPARVSPGDVLDAITVSTICDLLVATLAKVTSDTQ